LRIITSSYDWTKFMEILLQLSLGSYTYFYTREVGRLTKKGEEDRHWHCCIMLCIKYMYVPRFFCRLQIIKNVAIFHNARRLKLFLYI
jgi:hypothetical protein